MHISISLQHSKREKAEAEEHSEKERKRIDELEAIQVSEKTEGGRERMKGAHITKSVSGQRETRLRSGLKCLLVDSGKWIDNKLQPNKSRSGHHISCSLVSLHFLYGILTSQLSPSIGL